MKQRKPRTRQESFTDLRRSKLQLLLVSLLVYILFWVILDLVAKVFDIWRWQYLPALLGLVAIEGAITTRWITQAPRRVNRTLYRLAEITILLILTTVTYLLGLDNQIRAESLKLFLVTPLSIFDGSLAFWMAICLTAWRWSCHLTGIFNELAISGEEVAYFTTPSAERQQKGIAPVVPVYRRQLYDSFIRNWVSGGVFLAGLAMLSTIELSSGNLAAIQSLEFRNVTRLGLHSEHLMALVIYFTSGFWLASHARMAVMQARWIAGGRAIEPAVIHRWRRQVILIIFFVATATAFLPIGSSLAISRLIRAALNYLVIIFSFIIAVVPTVLAWVLSFLPNVEPTLEVTPVAPTESVLPPAQGGSQSIEIPPVILEAMFLSTAIAVAILAFVYFFKFRRFNLDLSNLAEAWRTFATMIRAAWLSLTGSSQELVTAIKGFARMPRAPTIFPRGSPLALPTRARTPGQQVRSYYLWLVNHAERQGIARPESKTPLEYEQLIAKHWPEIAADFRGMTRLFVQARYSSQPVADQDARDAESLVKRVRKGMRRRFKISENNEAD